MKVRYSAEHVLLYRGGEIRISNSAVEAEQLRRQGWRDTPPEGVEVSDEAIAEAERVFVESMTPDLEGENVSPTNPSGAEVPPDVQRQQREDRAIADFSAHEKADTHKASGKDAVMTTRDARKK